METKPYIKRAIFLENLNPSGNIYLFREIARIVKTDLNQPKTMQDRKIGQEIKITPAFRIGKTKAT